MNNITNILSNQPTIDFYEAIKQTYEGKKIHKLEWNDRNFYGVLNGGKLMLHKPDGKLYSWIISDGDIIGTDYIILP